jgi:choline-glycine betaine transporter
MKALRVESTEDASAAARVVSVLPVVYSITAAVCLAICVVLLSGSIVAQMTLKASGKKRTFTPDQSLLFSGVILMTMVNIALLVVGNRFFFPMMDALILWNFGMIIVLLHMSRIMSVTGMFRCLTLRHKLRLRDANKRRYTHQ